MAQRNKFLARPVEIDESGFTAAFTDGGVLRVTIASMTEAIRNRAAALGLKNSIMDRGAGAATLSEYRDGIMARYQQLLDGEWEKRAAGRAPTIDTETLVAAIVAASGGKVDGDKARSKVADWDAKTRAKFLDAQPKVAKEYAALRAAEAEDVDLEELFED